MTRGDNISQPTVSKVSVDSIDEKRKKPREMPLLRYAIRSDVWPLWCDERVPLWEEDDCYIDYVSIYTDHRDMWLESMGKKKRTPHQITRNEGKDERAAEEAKESRVSILNCLQFWKEGPLGSPSMQRGKHRLTSDYRPSGSGTTLLSRGRQW